MPNYRTALSYYGGKGMLINKYPKPRHKTIIEPFAGGAAYSLRWFMHDVILIEKNEKTCAAWNFIKSADALEWTENIPEKVNPGDKIDDLGKFPIGLEIFLRMAANVGTGGTNNRMNTITKLAAPHWYDNTIGKITFWHDKIQHWKIINSTYQDAPDVAATWFIDPPYQGSAGSEYYHNQIDYYHLGRWSQNRSGQIIVCENESANWLPFKNLTEIEQGFNSKHIAKNRPKECVFIHYN